MSANGRVASSAFAHGALLALGLALAVALGLSPAANGQPRPRRATPEGRSAIVYPLQRIAVRMDHAHPAHRALPCVQCHSSAPASRTSRDVLVPAESTCNPCHAAQTDRDAAGAATCGSCHVGYGADGTRVVPASSFPAPRLHFSHATHVRLGATCESCHAGVRDAALATRDHLPTMRQCLSCHGGARSDGARSDGSRGDGPATAAPHATRSAPSACTTCHFAEPDGVLRTRFAEGTLTPPDWLLGMGHDADWIVRHRWVGADQGPACASCHRESECADCHDGRVRPRAVHPNDYLTIHTQEARREPTRCASCHTTQRFCTECHARLGLATASAPAVRATGRYHPPAATWERAHALEAKRSLSACVSCHAERDCVSCHGALGIGGGLSPHPPGFAARCAPLLAANPRACVTCHGDVGALEGRCR
jgi:hypothetical protein